VPEVSAVEVAATEVAKVTMRLGKRAGRGGDAERAGRREGNHEFSEHFLFSLSDTTVSDASLFARMELELPARTSIAHNDNAVSAYLFLR
jgi:hypothetical protein